MGTGESASEALTIGDAVQLLGRDSRIVLLIPLRSDGNVQTAEIWNRCAVAAEQQYGSEPRSRIVEAEAKAERLDVSNNFDPASAASVGLNLKKLLWVRCGSQQMTTTRAGRRFHLPERYLTPSPIKKGLHGGGFGPHPRTEVRGLSDAVGELFEPRCAEPQHRPRSQKDSAESTCRR